MPKVNRTHLISRRSGTQYVAMVTELLSSYCGAHLLESYCKESNIIDTNWLRYLFSSDLIKIWRTTREDPGNEIVKNLVECLTSSLRLICIF